MDTILPTAHYRFDISSHEAVLFRRLAAKMVPVTSYALRHNTAIVKTYLFLRYTSKYVMFQETDLAMIHAVTIGKGVGGRFGVHPLPIGLATFVLYSRYSLICHEKR